LADEPTSQRANEPMSRRAYKPTSQQANEPASQLFGSPTSLALSALYSVCLVLGGGNLILLPACIEECALFGQGGRVHSWLGQDDGCC
jgi:hypothetical protein